MDKVEIDRQSKCQNATLEEHKQLWSGDHNTKKNVDAFKSICESCPVLNECREWGIVHESYANYGGMTRKERQTFRKSSQFLPMLYRAATEGWLNPEWAVARWEDIQDALFAAQAQTSQPETQSVDFEELVFEDLPFDLALTASFPEVPRLSDLIQQDIAIAEQTQHFVDAALGLPESPGTILPLPLRQRASS